MEITKIFENKQVRIQGTYEKPLFCASDVGDIIDIKNVRQVIDEFEDYEREVCNTYTLGGNQNMIFLTEAGLYHILCITRKPIGKQFRKWIFNEVLPEIRRTGVYISRKQLQIENMKVQTEYFKHFTKVYELLDDARVRTVFKDNLVNALGYNSEECASQRYARDISTLLNDEFGINDMSMRCKVGRYIVKRYREKYNQEPDKCEKYVNGDIRYVFCYKFEIEEEIINWMNEYINQ